MLIAAQPLWIVFTGHVLQGIGSAGVNPLAMAIIIEHAPTDTRGTALGTWNSIGPFSGMIGPVSAGVFIDAFGWRSLFFPAAATAALSVVLVA